VVSLSKLSDYFGLTNNSKLQHTSEYDTEMTVELLKKWIL
jgi:DNA polymerase III epsilon subunit-like protein